MKTSNNISADIISAPSFSFATTSLMRPICILKNGACLMGAWGQDVYTKGRALKLALMCPDGDVSLIYEFPKSKLVNKNALLKMTDLDGIDLSDLEELFTIIMEKKNDLEVQEDSSGKCSLEFAYQSLVEYVERYEMPGTVFIRDGYGNILRSYLPAVLEKLALGYLPLELSRQLKNWGVLRVNRGTGHMYTYKINACGRNDWYFSFKLPDTSNNLSTANNNKEVA